MHNLCRSIAQIISATTVHIIFMTVPYFHIWPLMTVNKNIVKLFQIIISSKEKGLYIELPWSYMKQVKFFSLKHTHTGNNTILFMHV